MIALFLTWLKFSGPNLSPIPRRNDKTLEGSLSSVSRPIFCDQGLFFFFKHFRDLQDCHAFAPLQFQIFDEISSNFFGFLFEFLQKILIFFKIFIEFFTDSDEFFIIIRI